MRKILVLFSLVTLSFSCQEKPDFIISEDEMVDVLVDIHMADGVLNTNSFPYDNERLRAENYYQNILDQHNINRQDFDSALSQYAQHRELYIDMYDKVIEKLRTKESFVQAHADSLKSENSTADLFYYKFYSDYESGLTIRPKQSKNITAILSRSGKHCYFVRNEKYSQSYSMKLTKPVLEVEYIFKAQVLFKEEPKIYPGVAFTIEKDGKMLSKYFYSLERFKPKLNIWTSVNTKTKLILSSPEADVVIKAYLYNRSKPEFYIDDYSLEIKQLK